MRDIDTVNGANVGRTAILNIVMQLRKCCNHPYLFPNTEDRNLDPMGEHLVENCGKVCSESSVPRDGDEALVLQRLSGSERLFVCVALVHVMDGRAFLLIFVEVKSRTNAVAAEVPTLRATEVHVDWI